MIKTRILLGWLTVALIFLASCTKDDSTVAPIYEANWQIIGVPPQFCFSSVGTWRFGITVHATDSYGQVMTDLAVNIEVTEGVGIVYPACIITDEEGKAYCTLHFTATNSTESVLTTITATSGENSRSESCQFIRTVGAVEISLTSPAQKVYAQIGEEVIVPLTATVREVRGYVIPDFPLARNIYPVSDGYAFGTLNGMYRTDANGCIELEFNSDGYFGEVFIVVGEAEPLNDEAVWASYQLEICRETSALADFSVEFELDTLFDKSDIDLYSANFIAIAMDENGEGIPELDLTASTNIGTLNRMLPTNASGISYGLLNLRPGIDCPVLSEEGIIARLTVTIPNTEYSAVDSLVIMPTSDD